MKTQLVYEERIKLIEKSKLNGKNKISGFIPWAVSFLRYGAGIISWTREELERMNKK